MTKTVEFLENQVQVRTYFVNLYQSTYVKSNWQMFIITVIISASRPQWPHFPVWQFWSSVLLQQQQKLLCMMLDSRPKMCSMAHHLSSVKTFENRDSSRDDPLDLEQLCSSKMCPGGMAAAWNCSCECRLPSDLCSVALAPPRPRSRGLRTRKFFPSTVRTKSSVVSRFSYRHIESSLLFLLPGTQKNASKKAQACIFYSPIFHPVTPYLMLLIARGAVQTCMLD